MTKRIELTQGQFTLVDDEDFDWLNQWKWYTDRNSNSNPIFYAASKINNQKIRMHRLILDAQKGEQCDHINGNTLDNRKSNLRIVTHRQNQQNKHINKTSKYPGVSWYKNYKKWRAGIQINYKSYTLGYFSSEEEAFEAYKKALSSLDEEVI